MQLLPHYIIVRRDRDGKTIWLHQDYLMSLLGIDEEYLRTRRSAYRSTVSRSHLTRDTLPNTGKSWRWATINDAFYYAYANIPDRAPVHYRSQLPSHAELIALAGQTERAAVAGELEPHFKQALADDYKAYLHCYGDCTKTQQANLAKAAAVLECAITWVRARNINLKKYEFINDFTSLLARYDVSYIPHNVRGFKRLLEQTVANGKPIAEAIKLPRAGNQFAAKYSDEEVRSWVLQLRGMSGVNFTNAHIIRKIKDACTLTCKPCPSDRWIGGIMQEHNTEYLTAQERWGSKGRYSAIYRGYVPLQNALFAGDCWQVDGTRVNLIDHKGEGGARQFLYIIAVRDVHSGDLLGWHFDLKEDRWAVFNALKMAIKETGYLPYEIAFDRFPGHNTPEMTDWLDAVRQLGTKVTFVHEAQGKASLERWFGTLQSVFMQDSAYYYGEGIKSRRKYAHRSEEAIKHMRKMARAEGFSFDDAVAEATGIIEAYRHTALAKYSRKHKTVELSPAQLYANSERPNVRALEEQELWWLCGLRIELPFHGAGLIKKEIQSVPFYYRTTDYSVISQHRRVIVCYDLDDLSQVMLYATGDGPLRQFLGRAHEEVPAQPYGPDAEWGAIGKRKALIKEFEGYREQELEYRQAVGSDIVAALSPAIVRKVDAERAETAVLIERWTGSDAGLDEGEGLQFNPWNQ